jgi:hypothetical protein
MDKLKTVLIIFFIVLVFIILAVFYNLKLRENNRFYNEEKFDRDLSQSIKIIHLVLFNPDEHYLKMYQTTRRYYKSLKNVRTLYYTFSENIDTEFVVKDDILYIKGKETYVPGILDKTIKAFEFCYLYMKDYDYVVRSNISTVIHMDLLRHHLLGPKNLDFGGGDVIKLGWIDNSAGISDKRYWGTEYPSGTSIIFSKSFFKRMMMDVLNGSKKFDRQIIDDLAIGIFVKYHYPDITPLYIKKGFVVNKPYAKDTVFYRNKHEDRRNDLRNIEDIVNHLLKDTE